MAYVGCRYRRYRHNLGVLSRGICPCDHSGIPQKRYPGGVHTPFSSGVTRPTTCDTSGCALPPGNTHSTVTRLHGCVTSSARPDYVPLLDIHLDVFPSLPVGSRVRPTMLPLGWMVYPAGGSHMGNVSLAWSTPHTGIFGGNMRLLQHLPILKAILDL